MGTLDHLTCLLRNLYTGQEATVRTGHGTTDWFQTGKRVCQGCILSPWLFNLYAKYIMWNAGLDEAQAGIKITMRNINALRYMAESKEKLKSLLMKTKGGQPWIFTGRTDAEAPILWPLMWRVNSPEKTNAGKQRVGREGSNRRWDGWMASSTQWTWVWENSGRQWRMGECAAVHGVTKHRTQLSNWTPPK